MKTSSAVFDCKKLSTYKALCDQLLYFHESNSNCLAIENRTPFVYKKRATVILSETLLSKTFSRIFIYYLA